MIPTLLFNGVPSKDQYGQCMKLGIIMDMNQLIQMMNLIERLHM